MNTTNKTHTTELFLLALLLIATPLSEAMKNITWLLYVITWVYTRFASSDSWGGKWGSWDTLFLIWISSGFIVAMLTTVHHQEWNGAWDVLRFAGVAWLVSRSNYSRSKLKSLIGIAVLATVIGTAHAVWAWKIGHTRPNLEIHSVGYVNHTAIYLVLAFGSALSFLVSKIWMKSYIAFFVVLITTIALASATLITSSRGSVLTLLLILPILFIFLSKSKTVASIISITILITMVAGAHQLQLPIYSKFERIFTHSTIKDGDVFSSSSIGYRNVNAEVALTVWKQYPFYGVGLENYGVVDNKKTINRYLMNQNKSPRDSFGEALGSGHAHNLYANTLAERGLIGFIPVMLVLFFWIKGLMLSYPITRATNSLHYKIIWGSALTGWLTVTVNGLFNTTLHHEHGLLAAFFLAAWVSATRRSKL